MKSNWQTIIMSMAAAVLTPIVVNSMNNYLNSKRRQGLSYNEFVQTVEAGEVDPTKVGSTEVTVIPKKGNAKYFQNLDYYAVRLEGDYDFVNRILDNNVVTNREKSGNSTLLLVLLNYTVPFPFLLFPMNFTTERIGGGGIVGMDKSNARMCVQGEIDTTFKDATGEDEARGSLTEIVDLLHDPGKYAKIGAKLSKGAPLVGPPRTGRTLLVKAVAGEAHVPFYSLSGSDFVRMFVGVGASRVHDLFKSATENAPCIIFIDEIDAIERSRNSHMGGNDEREQTPNQLFSEIGGFDSARGPLVLSVTNRPKVLDPALLRPGHFNRRVVVDRPDLNERISILKVHSKDVLPDGSADFEGIVLVTSGAMDADLVNMINEAAINAVRHGRNAVSQKDLFEAAEVVLVGKKKKGRTMSREERHIVSYHEVGRALVGAPWKHSEPAQKIIIVPKIMGALRYVMSVPEEGKYLNVKKELGARLVELMAGRAMGEIVFETVTTGAASDIQQAANLVRAMITQYDMFDKFGLVELASQENQYLIERAVLNCGDATVAEIDQEIMKILKDSYDGAKRLLSDNEDAMDQIAAFLIDKEMITGKEFMKMLREVKDIPEPEETKEDEDKIRALQEPRVDPKVQVGQGEQVNPGSQTRPEDPDGTNDSEDKPGDTIWSHSGNNRNLQDRVTKVTGAEAVRKQ